MRRAAAADTAELLRARARELARVPEAGRGEGRETMQLRVGEERLALDLRWVAAVAPRGALTPLPGAAPPLVALTAWRGEVLAVIDAGAALGLAAAGGRGEWLVVLGEGHAEAALLADALEGIAPLADDALAPPPAGVRHVPGQTPDGMLVVDVPSLLRSIP